MFSPTETTPRILVNTMHNGGKSKQLQATTYVTALVLGSHTLRIIPHFSLQLVSYDSVAQSLVYIVFLHTKGIFVIRLIYTINHHQSLSVGFIVKCSIYILRSQFAVTQK